MTTRSGKKYNKSDDSNGSDNSKEICAYMEGDHVPETVTHANVQDAVRRLPHAAFQDCRRLREVVLPEGLEEIGTCVSELHCIGAPACALHSHSDSQLCISKL